MDGPRGLKHHLGNQFCDARVIPWTISLKRRHEKALGSVEFVHAREPRSCIVETTERSCTTNKYLKCRPKVRPDSERAVRAIECAARLVRKQLRIRKKDIPRDVLRIIWVQRQAMLKRCDGTLGVTVKQQCHAKDEVAKRKAGLIPIALRAASAAVLAEPA